jgi:hypothetical protein
VSPGSDLGDAFGATFLGIAVIVLAIGGGHL